MARAVVANQNSLSSHRTLMHRDATALSDTLGNTDAIPSSRPRNSTQSVASLLARANVQPRSLCVALPCRRVETLARPPVPPFSSQ